MDEAVIEERWSRWATGMGAATNAIDRQNIQAMQQRYVRAARCTMMEIILDTAE